MSDIRTFIKSRKQRSRVFVDVWDVVNQYVFAEPIKSYQPHIWYWKDLRPLMLEAGKNIPLSEASRRVMILSNPSVYPKHYSTNTLYVSCSITIPVKPSFIGTRPVRAASCSKATVATRLRCPPDRHHLRMCRGVALRERTVAGLRDQIAVAHDYAADRDLAGGRRRVRFVERQFHESVRRHRSGQVVVHGWTVVKHPRWDTRP